MVNKKSWFGGGVRFLVAVVVPCVFLVATGCEVSEFGVFASVQREEVIIDESRGLDSNLTFSAMTRVGSDADSQYVVAASLLYRRTVGAAADAATGRWSPLPRPTAEQLTGTGSYRSIGVAASGDVLYAALVNDDATAGGVFSLNKSAVGAGEATWTVVGTPAGTPAGFFAVVATSGSVETTHLYLVTRSRADDAVADAYRLWHFDGAGFTEVTITATPAAAGYPLPIIAGAYYDGRFWFVSRYDVFVGAAAGAAGDGITALDGSSHGALSAAITDGGAAIGADPPPTYAARDFSALYADSPTAPGSLWLAGRTGKMYRYTAGATAAWEQVALPATPTPTLRFISSRTATTTVGYRMLVGSENRGLYWVDTTTSPVTLVVPGGNYLSTELYLGNAIATYIDPIDDRVFALTQRQGLWRWDEADGNLNWVRE